MKHLGRLTFVLMVSIAAAGLVQPAQASQDSKAVKTMAGILLKLNHFPSDAEKKTLQGLIDDKATTAHERTLAHALMHLQHAATAEDKPKLAAIGKDAAAPASVRTLADILLRLNHMPNAADKEKLADIAGGTF